MKDSIRVVAFGDLAIDSRRLAFSEDAMDIVRSLTTSADLALFNQEFPLTHAKTRNKHKSDYLAFRGHLQSAEMAKRAGFRLACFANNHTYNFLDRGIIDTINEFNARGIEVIGAGQDIHSARMPLYFEKCGIKLAILSYAEREANCATHDHGGAAPIDICHNALQIRELVERKFKVIVSLHTGIDFCGYPSPRVLNMCRFYADMGASAVFCHHSHMVSGYERYHGVPISYGLGNLLTNIIVSNECRYACGLTMDISEDSIDFDVSYFYNDPISSKLIELDSNQHNVFRDRVEKVNSSLHDAWSLENNIRNEFLTKDKIDYYYTLLTQSNHLTRRLFRKLKLQDIHLACMKNKMAMKNIDPLWNIIRCDNHRDVLDILYREL